MNFDGFGGKTGIPQSFGAFSPLEELGMKLRRQERDGRRTYMAWRSSSAGARGRNALQLKPTLLGAFQASGNLLRASKPQTAQGASRVAWKTAKSNRTSSTRARSFNSGTGVPACHRCANRFQTKAWEFTEIAPELGD